MLIVDLHTSAAVMSHHNDSCPCHIASTWGQPFSLLLLSVKKFVPVAGTCAEEAQAGGEAGQQGQAPAL